MPPTLNTSVRRTATGTYEFSANFVEISVLDRLGKAVWKSGRQVGQSRIFWTGVDLYGQFLDTGSYMFKLICSDNEAHYLPFIHTPSSKD